DFEAGRRLERELHTFIELAAATHADGDFAVFSLRDAGGSGGHLHRELVGLVGRLIGGLIDAWPAPRPFAVASGEKGEGRGETDARSEQTKSHRNSPGELGARECARPSSTHPILTTVAGERDGQEGQRRAEGTRDSPSPGPSDEATSMPRIATCSD